VEGPWGWAGSRALPTFGHSYFLGAHEAGTWRGAVDDFAAGAKFGHAVMTRRILQEGGGLAQDGGDAWVEHGDESEQPTDGFRAHLHGPLLLHPDSHRLADTQGGSMGSGMGAEGGDGGSAQGAQGFGSGARNAKHVKAGWVTGRWRWGRAQKGGSLDDNVRPPSELRLTAVGTNLVRTAMVRTVHAKRIAPLAMGVVAHLPQIEFCNPTRLGACCRAMGGIDAVLH
jgi:hypothetical protein